MDHGAAITDEPDFVDHRRFPSAEQKNVSVTLQRLLKEQRALKGISDNEFADSIGVTHQMLSVLKFSGCRSVTNTLAAVAKGLDVDPQYLLRGEARTLTNEASVQLTGQWGDEAASNVAKIVTELVHEAVIAHRMTEAEYARSIGISQPSVNHLKLRGCKRMTRPLMAVADSFGLCPAGILSGRRVPTTSPGKKSNLPALAGSLVGTDREKEAEQLLRVLIRHARPRKSQDLDDEPATTQSGSAAPLDWE